MKVYSSEENNTGHRVAVVNGIFPVGQVLTFDKNIDGLIDVPGDPRIEEGITFFQCRW